LPLSHKDKENSYWFLFHLARTKQERGLLTDFALTPLGKGDVFLMMLVNHVVLDLDLQTRERFII